MPAFVFKDAKVVMDGDDISGILNQVGLSYESELKDATVLGDDTRGRLSGLMTAEFALQGFWDTVLDTELFDNIGATADEVLSFAPDGHAVGDRAFFMKTRSANYNPGADLGEIFGFSLSAMSNEALVRGLLMVDSTETTSGNSASILFPAVASGERMFAAMHVLSAGGISPTLDMTVVSDSDGVFDSATSNTRMAFSQVTTSKGAQILSVDGAITDQHWRFEWDILDDSAGSPSYQLFCLLGITDK